MAEEFDSEKPEEEEDQEPSFADLLESYEAGMTDDLQAGDKVRGKIISVGHDAVFVDTGTKVDGVVEREELLDEEGNLPYAEGDEIELYVVSIDEHEIRLSRSVSGAGAVALLQDAFSGGIPVEGKVSATCKGGFNVAVAGRRAFCPISQIDVRYVDTPEDYVGKTFDFLISQFEENGRNIVVSRKKLLQRAMEKEKKAFFAELKEGDVLQGRVTNIMPYGAFVELIPGVEGMIHISELSWSRLDAPGEAVKPEDTVTVKVLEVKPGKKKGQKKIGLSVKQVEADPWQTVEEQFKPGEKVSGRVTRCMNFGAFVEIAPGIEGLVHISEMSYLKRIVNPEDVVSKGETVSVVIKEIDLSGRRISLSLRDAEGDPWLEVNEKFGVGQVVDGTVEKKENFGLFVSLAPGITGLLPKSKFSRAEKPAALEGLKAGDSISVTVEEIHPQERKLTLAPGDAKEEGDWKNFKQPKSAAPMSDLAEKLQNAMKDKKGS